MRLNIAPEEAFPVPEPEPGRPELYGIEGGGEVVYSPEAEERRAAFHVVIDEADPAHEEVEITDAEEADKTELRAAIAAKTSRLLSRSGTTLELADAFSDGDYHKRGGGGGAFWWFLKMQAEKYHDEGCSCSFCAA
jgi:hypothetical protein